MRAAMTDEKLALFRRCLEVFSTVELDREVAEELVARIDAQDEAIARLRNQVPGLSASLDESRWQRDHLARLILHGMDAPNGGWYPPGSVEVTRYANLFVRVFGLSADRRISEKERTLVAREANHALDDAGKDGK